MWQTVQYVKCGKMKKKYRKNAEYDVESKC